MPTAALALPFLIWQHYSIAVPAPLHRVLNNLSHKSQAAWLRRRFGSTKALCPPALDTSHGWTRPEEPPKSALPAPLCSLRVFPWHSHGTNVIFLRIKPLCTGLLEFICSVCRS